MTALHVYRVGLVLCQQPGRLPRLVGCRALDLLHRCAGAADGVASVRPELEGGAPVRLRGLMRELRRHNDALERIADALEATRTSGTLPEESIVYDGSAGVPIVRFGKPRCEARAPWAPQIQCMERAGHDDGGKHFGQAGGSWREVGDLAATE